VPGSVLIFDHWVWLLQIEFSLKGATPSCVDVLMTLWIFAYLVIA
jgi:hypothetical protein